MRLINYMQRTKRFFLYFVIRRILVWEQFEKQKKKKDHKFYIK